jgi:hypothetical protein
MREMPTEAAQRERTLADMRHDVAERLRLVCAGWSQEAFTQLVAQIAEITYKYDVIRDHDVWASADRWSAE